MKAIITKGATDVTLIVFIQDSSSTTGAGLTGLTFESSSLVCYYCRPGAAATQLTLVTQTVTGAHSDGGFVEVSSANMPGVYRLDLSDAVVATGVNSVVLMLKGATNMAPLPIEIELEAVDRQDATDFGLTGIATKAEIADEVFTSLGTDTIAAVTTDPGTTPTVNQILRLVYQALRNKITATDSELALYNDAGSAEAFNKALSDDDTTFTSGTLTDA